jgi:hypothetical protein
MQPQKSFAPSNVPRAIQATSKLSLVIKVKSCTQNDFMVRLLTRLDFHHLLNHIITNTRFAPKRKYFLSYFQSVF